MARGKTNTDVPVNVERGAPPASTRSGRSLHPQIQALIEQCRNEPGEWFNLDAGSVSTAASRKSTLNKHGLKATIRGQVVFARTMSDDEIAAEAVEATEEAEAA